MRDTPNNRFPGHFRDFIKELKNHGVEYLSFLEKRTNRKVS